MTQISDRKLIIEQILTVMNLAEISAVSSKMIIIKMITPYEIGQF